MIFLKHKQNNIFIKCIAALLINAVICFGITLPANVNTAAASSSYQEDYLAPRLTLNDTDTIEFWQRLKVLVDSYDLYTRLKEFRLNDAEMEQELGNNIRIKNNILYMPIEYQGAKCYVCAFGLQDALPPTQSQRVLISNGRLRIAVIDAVSFEAFYFKNKPKITVPISFVKLVWTWFISLFLVTEDLDASLKEANISKEKITSLHPALTMAIDFLRYTVLLSSIHRFNSMKRTDRKYAVTWGEFYLSFIYENSTLHRAYVDLLDYIAKGRGGRISISYLRSLANQFNAARAPGEIAIDIYDFIPLIWFLERWDQHRGLFNIANGSSHGIDGHGMLKYILGSVINRRIVKGYDTAINDVGHAIRTTLIAAALLMEIKENGGQGIIHELKLYILENLGGDRRAIDDFPLTGGFDVNVVNLIIAGLAHDLGKNDREIARLANSNQIYPSDAPERAIIARHPDISVGIFRDTLGDFRLAQLGEERVRMIEQLIRYHHNPEQVSPEYRLYAWVLHVADIIDAANSKRPYSANQTTREPVIEFLDRKLPGIASRGLEEIMYGIITKHFDMIVAADGEELELSEDLVLNGTEVSNLSSANAYGEETHEDMRAYLEGAPQIPIWGDPRAIDFDANRAMNLKFVLRQSGVILDDSVRIILIDHEHGAPGSIERKMLFYDERDGRWVFAHAGTRKGQGKFIYLTKAAFDDLMRDNTGQEFLAKLFKTEAEHAREKIDGTWTTDAHLADNAAREFVANRYPDLKLEDFYQYWLNELWNNENRDVTLMLHLQATYDTFLQLADEDIVSVDRVALNDIKSVLERILKIETERNGGTIPQDLEVFRRIYYTSGPDDFKNELKLGMIELEVRSAERYIRNAVYNTSLVKDTAKKLGLDIDLNKMTDIEITHIGTGSSKEVFRVDFIAAGGGKSSFIVKVIKAVKQVSDADLEREFAKQKSFYGLNREFAFKPGVYLKLADETGSFIGIMTEEYIDSLDLHQAILKIVKDKSLPDAEKIKRVSLVTRVVAAKMAQIWAQTEDHYGPLDTKPANMVVLTNGGRFDEARMIDFMNIYPGLNELQLITELLTLNKYAWELAGKSILECPVIPKTVFDAIIDKLGMEQGKAFLTAVINLIESADKEATEPWEKDEARRNKIIDYQIRLYLENDVRRTPAGAKRSSQGTQNVFEYGNIARIFSEGKEGWLIRFDVDKAADLKERLGKDNTDQILQRMNKILIDELQKHDAEFFSTDDVLQFNGKEEGYIFLPASLSQEELSLLMANIKDRISSEGLALTVTMAVLDLTDMGKVALQELHGAKLTLYQREKTHSMSHLLLAKELLQRLVQQAKDNNGGDRVVFYNLTDSGNESGDSKTQATDSIGSSSSGGSRQQPRQTRPGEHLHHLQMPDDLHGDGLLDGDGFTHGRDGSIHRPYDRQRFEQGQAPEAEGPKYYHKATIAAYQAGLEKYLIQPWARKLLGEKPTEVRDILDFFFNVAGLTCEEIAEFTGLDNATVIRNANGCKLKRNEVLISIRKYAPDYKAAWLEFIKDRSDLQARKYENLEPIYMVGSILSCWVEEEYFSRFHIRELIGITYQQTIASHIQHFELNEFELSGVSRESAKEYMQAYDRYYGNRARLVGREFKTVKELLEFFIIEEDIPLRELSQMTGISDASIGKHASICGIKLGSGRKTFSLTVRKKYRDIYARLRAIDKDLPELYFPQPKEVLAALYAHRFTVPMIALMLDYKKTDAVYRHIRAAGLDPEPFIRLSRPIDPDYPGPKPKAAEPKPKQPAKKPQVQRAPKSAINKESVYDNIVAVIEKLMQEKQDTITYKEIAQNYNAAYGTEEQPEPMSTEKLGRYIRAMIKDKDYKKLKDKHLARLNAGNTQSRKAETYTQVLAAFDAVIERKPENSRVSLDEITAEFNRLFRDQSSRLKPSTIRTYLRQMRLAKILLPHHLEQMPFAKEPQDYGIYAARPLETQDLLLLYDKISKRIAEDGVEYPADYNNFSDGAQGFINWVLNYGVENRLWDIINDEEATIEDQRLAKTLIFIKYKHVITAVCLNIMDKQDSGFEELYSTAVGLFLECTDDYDREKLDRFISYLMLTLSTKLRREYYELNLGAGSTVPARDYISMMNAFRDAGQDFAEFSSDTRFVQRVTDLGEVILLEPLSPAQEQVLLNYLCFKIGRSQKTVEDIVEAYRMGLLPQDEENISLADEALPEDDSIAAEDGLYIEPKEPQENYVLDRSLYPEQTHELSDSEEMAIERLKNILRRVTPKSGDLNAERFRKIIRLRYFEERQITEKEIGNKVDVTESRISQILKPLKNIRVEFLGRNDITFEVLVRFLVEDCSVDKARLIQALGLTDAPIIDADEDSGPPEIILIDDGRRLILDIGGASGKSIGLNKTRLSEGNRVIVLDVTESNIARAEGEFSETDAITFVQGDVRDMPPELNQGAKFDEIHVHCVLKNILCGPEELSGIIENFAQILKPGGKIFISGVKYQCNFELIGSILEEQGLNLVRETEDKGEVLQYFNMPRVPGGREFSEVYLSVWQKPAPEVEDVLIIGAGPAGLTAGMYLARDGFTVKVLNAGLPGGNVGTAAVIENYPGFPHGINGLELADRMKQQAEEHGVEIIMDNVLSISTDLATGDKIIKTYEQEYRARKVIIATGTRYRRLDVPGESRLLNKGISYCATCDGPLLARGKEVVVVGGGNTAAHEALHLAALAKKVTLIHRRGSLRAEKAMQDRLKQAGNIEIIYDAVVEEFIGEDRLTGLSIKDNKTGRLRQLNADAAFIAVGMIPETGFLKDYVKLDENGYVMGDNYYTSQPGVYVAGSVRNNAFNQISASAGEGATVARVLIDEKRELLRPREPQLVADFKSLETHAQEGQGLQRKKSQVIVVGAGPAGLTAGMYLARDGYTVTLLEESFAGGNVNNATPIENYPGFPGSADGVELSQAMSEQAARAGVIIEQAKVSGIFVDPNTGRKIIKTQDNEYEAESVVIATGATYRKLGLAREDEFRGLGISYCVSCDGPRFEGKNVVIVGAGNKAMEDALALAGFAKSVTLVFPEDIPLASNVLTDRVRSLSNVTFVKNSRVTALLGDDKISGITIEDVDTGGSGQIDAEGVFVSIGVEPNAEFLGGIFELDERGYLITDRHKQTAIEGVFVAGSVRSGATNQIISSVGEGAEVSVSVGDYLDSLSLNVDEGGDSLAAMDALADTESLDLVYGVVEKIKQALANKQNPKILFICSGNYFRSPAMEMALRYLLREAGITNVEVISAGTNPSSRSYSELYDAALYYGIPQDIIDVVRSRERPARKYTAQMIEDADLIFVAARTYYNDIIDGTPDVQAMPEAKEKTILFTELAPERFKDENVPDYKVDEDDKDGMTPDKLLPLIISVLREKLVPILKEHMELSDNPELFILQESLSAQQFIEQAI